MRIRALVTAAAALLSVGIATAQDAPAPHQAASFDVGPEHLILAGLVIASVAQQISQPEEEVAEEEESSVLPAVILLGGLALVATADAEPLENPENTGVQEVSLAK